jgi:hypothetical protein
MEIPSMFRFDRKCIVHAGFVLASVLLAGRAAEAQINLTAGDVALIGWVDNGSPNDQFTFVTLADLPAGTKLYFTDSGWDSVNSMFRNTIGPTNGTGNEQIVRFETSALVPAGTIVTSYVAGSGYAWITSGPIPGSNSGNHAPLVLAQTGDQIYCFQHDTGQNPLNTPTKQHLFVLDDTGTFESATSTATGDVPPGLSAAAHTALTFQQNGTGQDFMAFNTAVLASGTKTDWLAAIGDPANWTLGASGALPTGSIVVVPTILFSDFCFGDSSSPIACPCNNTGAMGHGCDNSAMTGGAVLSASGTTHPDTVVLRADGELASSFTVFLQGDASAALPMMFGDGLSCLSGTVIKIAVKRASSGSASYPESGDPSISSKSAALGNVLLPGTSRNYQAVYRDPDANFCPSPLGNMLNITNAVRINW